MKGHDGFEKQKQIYKTLFYTSNVEYRDMSYDVPVLSRVRRRRTSYVRRTSRPHPRAWLVAGVVLTRGLNIRRNWLGEHIRTC